MKHLHFLFFLLLVATAARAQVKVPFADLVGKPTTLSGYGIIDAAALTTQGYLAALPAYVDASRHASIKAAIAALPAEGGVIIVPVGRFRSGYVATSFETKANVSIVGMQKPRVDAAKTRLEGGSVIEGPLPFWAENISIKNVGVDSGPTVCAAYYANVAQEGLVISNQSAEGDSKASVLLSDVIALAKSPTALVHAILVEGVSRVSATNIHGINGIHGVVLKSQLVNASGIFGEDNNNDNVILKSDVGAAALSGINASNIHAIGDGAWGVLIEANPGVASALNISNVFVRGAKTAAGMELRVVSGYLTDINLSNLVLDGYGIAGSGACGLKIEARRVNISGVVLNNWVTALYHESDYPAAATISYDGLVITNATQGVSIVTPANFGTVSFDQVTTAWVLGSTGVRVSNATYRNVTNRFNSAPSLANGWAEFGSGQSPIGFDLRAGGLLLRGLVRGIDASTNTLFSLPLYLRPANTRRYAVTVFDGTTHRSAELVVGNDGNVNIAPSRAWAMDYVSLDGVLIDL
jgi:hypothetical protein